MANRFIGPLIIALTLAIVVLAATSAYSAWVSTTLHSKQCARSDLALDALHDVVVIAYTPPPGVVLSAQQVKEISAVEGKAFARIDKARC